MGNYYKHFTILLVLTVVVAFHKKKTRLECGDTRYCRGNNNNSKLGLKGEKRSASCSQREEEEDDDAKESEVKESDEEEEGRAEHTEGGCRKINKCSTGKEHSCMISSKLCVCVCVCVCVSAVAFQEMQQQHNDNDHDRRRR